MLLNYFYLFLCAAIFAYLINIYNNYLLNLLLIMINIIAVIFLLNKKEKKRVENYSQNNNLIAAITHDLKTPVISNIRALELLLNEKFGVVSDTQRSFLNDILNSNYNMLDMVMNMLWLYKFDNNKVVINKTYFSINDLIFDILNENKLLVKSKNHTLNQILDYQDSYIYADKMQMKRIISNFLTNAINHSYENTTISIKTEVFKNQLTFKVTSLGKSIKTDIIGNLSSIDNVFKEKSDCLSTGLGLYLSNSMLKLNNAEFIYNSTPEGKNTFGFIIKSVSDIKNKKTSEVSLPI